jgi:hypothetical protein
MALRSKSVKVDRSVLSLYHEPCDWRTQGASHTPNSIAWGVDLRETFPLQCSNTMLEYNARKLAQSSEEMSDKSIAIQLPEALLAAIDAQAQFTRTSRTETIVQMLQQGLECIPSDPLDRIAFRVEALEQKVADLVDRLEGRVLEDLKVRLSALERVAPLDRKTVEAQQISETIANSLQTQKVSQATSGSKLENSIDTEWMTVKEAFAWLGGDPKDPSSGVTSLDGRRSVGFHRFRVLKAADYKAFGLKFQSDRRRQQMPCLKPFD